MEIQDISGASNIVIVSVMLSMIHIPSLQVIGISQSIMLFILEWIGFVPLIQFASTKC